MRHVTGAYIYQLLYHKGVYFTYTLQKNYWRNGGRSSQLKMKRRRGQNSVQQRSFTLKSGSASFQQSVALLAQRWKGHDAYMNVPDGRIS